MCALRRITRRAHKIVSYFKFKLEVQIFLYRSGGLLDEFGKTRMSTHCKRGQTV